jgi:hypothetical protein
MLLLIGVSFLLPVALSTTLLTRALTATIRLAELEEAGVRYQTPLFDLLVGVTSYANLARTGAPLDGARADIAAAFAALASAQESLGERLGTTQESWRRSSALAATRESWRLDAELRALRPRTRQPTHAFCRRPCAPAARHDTRR